MKLMSLHNRTIIREGSKKDIYLGSCSNQDIIHLSFKDTVDFIPHAGILHNSISEKFFTFLNTYRIPTHFIRNTNLRDQEVFNTKPIRLIVRMTNIVHSDFHQMLGLGIGQQLKAPLLDFISLDTGTIIDSAYLSMLDICTLDQMQQIRKIAQRVNDLFCALTYMSPITPASIDLQFGFCNSNLMLDHEPGLIIIDELTPQTVQFWHKEEACIIPYNIELIKILSNTMNINVTRWNEYLYTAEELAAKKPKPTPCSKDKDMHIDQANCILSMKSSKIKLKAVTSSDVNGAHNNHVSENSSEGSAMDQSIFD